MMRRLRQHTPQLRGVPGIFSAMPDDLPFADQVARLLAAQPAHADMAAHLAARLFRFLRGGEHDAGEGQGGSAAAE